MTKANINLQKLRQMIQEELDVNVVNEAVDHKNISSIVGVVSKLLAAVEGFKEKAPPAAINAVTPHLSNLEKVLEDMMSSPSSYVPMLKKEPQKVTLKAVKNEALELENDLNETFMDTMKGVFSGKGSKDKALIAAAQKAGWIVAPSKLNPGEYDVKKANSSKGSAMMTMSRDEVARLGAPKGSAEEQPTLFKRGEASLDVLIKKASLKGWKVKPYLDGDYSVGRTGKRDEQVRIMDPEQLKDFLKNI